MYTFNADTKIEFGEKIYGMFDLKRGIVKFMDMLAISSGRKMKQINETSYKLLPILQKDKLIQKEMTTI